MPTADRSLAAHDEHMVVITRGDARDAAGWERVRAGPRRGWNSRWGRWSAVLPSHFAGIKKFTVVVKPVRKFLVAVTATLSAKHVSDAMPFFPTVEPEAKALVSHTCPGAAPDQDIGFRLSARPLPFYFYSSTSTSSPRSALAAAMIFSCCAWGTMS